MRHVALVLALAALSCGSDAPEVTYGAAGAPAVDVQTSQFIAPAAVGVASEKLTQAYSCINSVSGSSIWRSNGSYDGLRCWVMRFGSSSCNPNQYSCTYNSGTHETNCKAGTSNYSTSCTSTGCGVHAGATIVGTFQYGSSGNYVFRTGTAPSFAYATCGYVDSAHQTSGHPTFTQSTSPL